MSDKTAIPNGWGAQRKGAFTLAADTDATKLRIIQALVTVSLKSGLSFGQFAEAVAAAGITFPVDGGRDCTDIEADIRALLGITLVDEAANACREARILEIMTQVLEILRRVDARAAQAPTRPFVA